MHNLKKCYHYRNFSQLQCPCHLAPAGVAVCDRVLCLSSLFAKILPWSKANSLRKSLLILHSLQKNETFFFPEFLYCSFSTTPDTEDFFPAMELCLYHLSLLAPSIAHSLYIYTHLSLMQLDCLFFPKVFLYLVCYYESSDRVLHWIMLY